jgi:hypothetical protein
VLLEDLAALFGLVFALFGVGMTLATHDGRWDAVGTAMIGALLVTVATVLAVEMNSLLIGESATPEHLAAISGALVGGGVQRVIHMKVMHLGPEELLVAAKIAIGPGITGTELAQAIDDAERRVRTAVPIARVIYLEPDLDRESRPRPEQPPSRVTFLSRIPPGGRFRAGHGPRRGRAGQQGWRSGRAGTCGKEEERDGFQADAGGESPAVAASNSPAPGERAQPRSHRHPGAPGRSSGAAASAASSRRGNCPRCRPGSFHGVEPPGSPGRPGTPRPRRPLLP